MSEAFANNWEYLEAELAHLDLLIKAEVARFRDFTTENRPDLFRGIYISDAEIDSLTADSDSRAVDQAASSRQRAAELQEEIWQRRQATLKKGWPLSLPQLARLFDLTRFEEALILICLAPEIDLKYQRLYAYLQDDIARRKPSVDLALKLLCSSPDERRAARAAFSAGAILFRAHLLQYHEAGQGYALSREFCLDHRIVSLLLGTDDMDRDLSACFKPAARAIELEAVCLPEDVKAGTRDLIQNYLSGTRQQQRLICDLHGPSGAGRKTFAATICREAAIPLITVDLRELLVRHEDFEKGIRRVLREAVLVGAAILIDQFDLLLTEDEQARQRLQQTVAAIEEFSWVTFVSTERAWKPGGWLRAHVFVDVHFPVPDLQTRAELWPALAGDPGRFSEEINWEELAVKFRFTAGQINDALIAARNHALARTGPDQVITMADLYRGCRDQSNQKLSSSARKLTPRHSWQDLILPHSEMAQLGEICAQLKHRRKVYGEWGFGRKVSPAKGLCVFFYGPSGTGKTTAAEILAKELQLEVYKVDLSAVVSKYIGETEKNLSAIFNEAETSNAILFFDEADALFGKRSEVKDAHDRYANIEINFLLQRMEEFEGLVVLATNLRKNIDEAFFRRMHFAVEFPFPEEKYRYEIWKRHFPDTAPLAEDIDFNFLANRLNITGGNIKNIVVNAAFMAAANSGVINMRHLVRAASREYAKIGRLCTEAEFAPYHGLLRLD